MVRINIVIIIILTLTLFPLANAVWTAPPQRNGQLPIAIQNITIVNPDTGNSIPNGAVYNFTIGANQLGNYINGGANNIGLWDGNAANFIYLDIMGNSLNPNQQTSMNTINSLIGYGKLDFSVAPSGTSTNGLTLAYYPMNDVVMDGNNICEAPQLTPNAQGGYGRFDCGANVMTGLYQAFIGSSTPAGWTKTGAGAAISNGIQLTRNSGAVSSVLTTATYGPNTANILEAVGELDGLGSFTNTGLGYTDTGVGGQWFGNDGTGSAIVDVAGGSHKGVLSPTINAWVTFDINYQTSVQSKFNFNYGAWDTIGFGTASENIGAVTWQSNSGNINTYFIGERNYYYAGQSTSFGPVIVTGSGNTVTLALTTPITYGTTQTITGTTNPITDNVEVLITGGVFGTSNVVCGISIHTCSYNFPVENVGTYTVNAFSPSSKVSNVLTLTINKASHILTLTNCTNQVLPFSCTTTATEFSVSNQVASTLFLDNGLVGTTNALSNSINYQIANTINVETFVFNSPSTTNYNSNSVTVQWLGFVYVKVQNASTTYLVMPTLTANTLASNTLSTWHYPFKVWTSSPFNSITYTVSNAYETNVLANVPGQISVLNASYIISVNSFSGNYIIQVVETQYSNSLTVNELFNPLSMSVLNNCAPAFNDTEENFQYLPLALYIPNTCWFSLPASWQLNGYTANAFGNVIDTKGSGTLSLPFNIKANYFNPTYSFNLTSALGLSATSTSLLAFQVTSTNGMAIDPVVRNLVEIDSFNERTFNVLIANTTFFATFLLNNYTFSKSAFWTDSSFNIYTTNSFFQNPSIAITNITTTSRKALFLNAVNQFCSAVVPYGSHQTYQPYLVETANGTSYTFQVVTNGGYLPAGYFMAVQEFTGSAFKQVGVVKTTGGAFAYPLLLLNVVYRFLIYSPNCNNLIFTSPGGVWVNPIQLTVSSQGPPPSTFNTINASASCKLVGNKINCIGIDTRNFVSSWNIRVFNVSGAFQILSLIQNVTINGASFNFTSVVINTSAQQQVQIRYLAGGSSGVALIWNSPNVSKFINPFLAGGAFLGLLVWFTLIGIGGEVGWDVGIALGDLALFLLIIFGILPLPSGFLYVLIFVDAIMIVAIEVPKVLGG